MQVQVYRERERKKGGSRDWCFPPDCMFSANRTIFVFKQNQLSSNQQSKKPGVCVCVCVCVYKNDIVNRFGYGSLGGLRYFPLQDPNGQMEIYQRFAEEIFLQNRNKARPQEVSLWRQEYRADV